MMGGLELLAGLQDAVDPAQVRVVRAPCMGRCDTAPVCEVGHRHVDKAGVAQALAVIGLDDLHPGAPDHVGLERYLADGGYGSGAACARPRATRWRKGPGHPVGPRRIRPARPGRRRLPDRSQVGAGPPAARAALHVRQRRRGRAGDVQGPALPGGRPAPLPRGRARRAPASSRPSGCSSTCATSIRPRARSCCTRSRRSRRPGWSEPGFIELRRGAGAYICGEESSMIESIEGKRGYPRNRPPYVAQVGAFGRPTLVNNVETLFWVRDIVEKGAAWFAGQGRNGSKGLRILLGIGAGEGAGRQAGAGWHHRARADRRVLRRHGGRPQVPRLPAGRRLGRHPAGLDGRHPARLRQARAARLLRRLARGRRSSRTRTTSRRRR